MRTQSAFEKAGILFLDDYAGGGIGVRLQKKPSEARFGFANAYINAYHILIRSSCRLYHFLIHKPA